VKEGRACLNCKICVFWSDRQLTIYEVIECDIHRSVLGPDGRLYWWVVGFICTEWAWGVPWLEGGIRMEELLTFECIHVV